MERVDLPCAQSGTVARDDIARDKVAKRTCVLVLGMHRSGTSAVSGTLAEIGAMRPIRELPPQPDNPKGFFEPAEIVAIHDRMLLAVGARWSDWDPLPGSFFDTEANAVFRENLVRAVHEDYPGSCPFLLKDPRICRFMTLWTSIFEEIGVKAEVIHVFRHPIEVALSLQARNKLSFGHGLLLWLRYVLDSEYGTRNLNRVFTEYSKLLNNHKGEFSRIFQELNLKLEYAPNLFDENMPSFVDQNLRHHDLGACELDTAQELSVWVREAFSALCVLQTDPNAVAPMRVLDGIRHNFDAACSTFAAALRALPCDAGISTLGERRNENIEAELTEARARLGSVQLVADRSVALDAELAEARARLGPLQLEADRSVVLEAELTEARAQLGSVQLVADQNVALEAELTEARERLGPLQLVADRSVALEAELTETRARLGSIQLVVDRSIALEAELTEARARLGSIQLVVDRSVALEAELTEARARLGPLQLGADRSVALEAELTEARARLGSIQLVVDRSIALEAELTEARARLGSIQLLADRSVALEAELTEARARLGSIQVVADRSVALEAELTEARARLGSIQLLADRSIALEAELTEARARFGSIQMVAERSVALEAELTEARARLGSIQLVADRSVALEAELTEARARLGSSRWWRIGASRSKPS